MRPQFAPGMFGQDAIAELLMSDSFTEVATQGFLSRLMGSFIGLLVGPLLVIAAIILLSWNEGRAVEAIRGLSEAATKAVEVSNAAPAPVNDNRLVHVIGAATATTPVADPDMNLGFHRADRRQARRRDVSMDRDRALQQSGQLRRQPDNQDDLYLCAELGGSRD